MKTAVLYQYIMPCVVYRKRGGGINKDVKLVETNNLHVCVNTIAQWTQFAPPGAVLSISYLTQWFAKEALWSQPSLYNCPLLSHEQSWGNTAGFWDNDVQTIPLHCFWLFHKRGSCWNSCVFS